MKNRSRGAALLAFALLLSLIPFSANSNSHGAGPQGPPCGIHKVKKNEVIAGVNFPKGSYQINAFGISCSKVLGKKGLFAKFLKLKDKDPLPKPWKYLADAVGAPKFSSGPGVGFRVQLISQLTPTPSSSPTPTSSAAPPPTNLEFEDVSVRATGETTAEFTFKAQGYLSYRVYVVLVSDPNGKEISSTKVTNFSERTVNLDLSGLECGRTNFYEARVAIFSGRDGTGNDRVAGAKIAATGACTIPRPSFTDTYKEPSRTSKSLDMCKIQETSNIRKRISEQNQGIYKVESITGFPKTESRIPSKGNIRFIAIPIDWSDSPGEANFVNKWKEQFEIFTDWASTVSEGKVKVDVTIHNKWIRVPGSSTSYSVPFSEANPQSGEFWSKVLPTIDPVIDFTGYQFVIFILPSGQKFVRESIQELYPGGAIKDYPPKEGKILAYLGTGMYFENWNVKQWTYFAHELGHLLDLAHGGGGRWFSSMSGLDIMFSQDGPSRTLSGWWRFLANWLEPTQLFCDDVNNFEELNISLAPIDGTAKGVKVAILRISPTKVLVIESRRYTRFDNELRQSLFQRDLVKEDWNGILIYEYDATSGHLTDFFKPVASNTALSEYNWDGVTRYISKESEVVEHAGLRFSVTKSGNFDALNIRKSTSSELSAPRPTPSPAPSPTTNDFNVEPFVFGGAVRESETTALSTWYGRFFRSYRIQVVNSSSPNSAPLFDTGIVNDYRTPILVNITKLTCSRDLTEVAVFYSGLDGKGKSTRIEQSSALSAVNIGGDGKCTGYWTNGAQGKD